MLNLKLPTDPRWVNLAEKKIDTVCEFSILVRRKYSDEIITKMDKLNIKIK